jgi:hypothetical protein
MSNTQLLYLLGYVIQAHHGAAGKSVFTVTVLAAQWATGQAHKNRWAAYGVGFALKRQKNLSNSQVRHEYGCFPNGIRAAYSISAK